MLKDDSSNDADQVRDLRIILILLCSNEDNCGTPAQRNRNAPYSSPEIEEKSSGIRHCLRQNKSSLITKDKYKGPMLQRITLARRHYACDSTLALCQQQNNSQQWKSSSSGTTTKVVNSTPQGLWMGHDLARTHGNHRQAINQSRHHLQSGMTRQVSTLNVLASSQQPKTSRQDNNIALSRLIKLTGTMIQQQLLITI